MITVQSLCALLTDLSIGVIVVEHRDRLTRFGFNYIEQLMQTQGRHLEVIFPSDTDTDLVDDAHCGHDEHGKSHLWP